MTDDIVTRLRKQVADHHCYWNGDKCRDCRNQNHAADEIERLRKERTYYEEMCSIIADKNFTANQEVDRLRAELKAVRHESA